MSNIVAHGRTYKQTMPRFARGGEDVGEWTPVADSKGEIKGAIKTLGEVKLKFNQNYTKELQIIVRDWGSEDVDDEYWWGCADVPMGWPDDDLEETYEEIKYNLHKCSQCGKTKEQWMLNEGGEICIWCHKRNMSPYYNLKWPEMYDITRFPNHKLNSIQEQNTITKMETNYELRCLMDPKIKLKPKNQRIKKEMEKELMSIVDDPHKLLGKLCIRMDAMELNDEWEPTDFPNIPTYK